MLKQRLIFTLLYSSEYFMLSRNFRLQKVGDLEWINKHYNFQNISFSIDELVVLNVSRNKKDNYNFCKTLKKLSEQCFIPMAAGGGIRSENNAEVMLKSGADKIVVNTILIKDPPLVKKLVLRYGSQCIVASVDFKLVNNEFRVFIENGTEKIQQNFKDYVANICHLGVGEIYLNSIDKDGTGQGYFLKILDNIDKNIRIPIIMAGGAGNYNHLFEGIQQDNVDAVATANLYNFIGDALPNAREKLLNEEVPMALWKPEEKNLLKGYFNS
jgi:imidazole glycerol-phosphate synthase subunit HisF